MKHFCQVITLPHCGLNSRISSLALLILFRAKNSRPQIKKQHILDLHAYVKFYIALMYSAGRKFRTFKSEFFFWPLWRREVNFEMMFKMNGPQRTSLTE